MTIFDFLKTHERLLIAVLAVTALFITVDKGISAWENHDKQALVAQQSVIDKQHLDNQKLQDVNQNLLAQLAALKSQVEKSNAKSDQIIAQLRKKTSDQQTIDTQLPPPQLSARWTTLLDLKPETIAPAPDNKYLLTDEAARATVVQLERVPELVQDTIQLEAKLDGETQIVVKQDEVILGLQKEIAGKDLEIADEVKARRLEVNLAKAATKKAFIRGFKWGFAAGAATVIAVRVGFHI